MIGLPDGFWRCDSSMTPSLVSPAGEVAGHARFNPGAMLTALGSCRLDITFPRKPQISAYLCNRRQYAKRGAMRKDGVFSPSPAEHPLIVSYYTPGTAYETNARRLSIAARIEPRPARGSWVENCAQKAGFIRELHRQEQRPLLWLDADARLRRPLGMLQGIFADLAIVREWGWAFYSGQIYFGAGPAATRLLDRWCGYCERFPEIWDQVSLGYAWWELTLQEPLKTQWLGRNLFQKVPRSLAEWLHYRISRPAPILQQQESRRSKGKQGAPTRPEFGMDDVPLWWRKAAARDAPFTLDAAQRGALGLA
jgi:hypothetical protein